MMMRYIALVGLLTGLLSGLAPGAAATDETIGNAKIVNGRVVVLRDGVETPIKGGDALFRMDVIITGQNGSVGLIFKDNSRLSLGADSRLTFREFRFAPGKNSLSFISELAHGTLQYISGVIAKLAPESVSVITPVATIAVRGTRFLVRIPKTDG
jgi:hypothetical protein